MGDGYERGPANCPHGFFEPERCGRCNPSVLEKTTPIKTYRQTPMGRDRFDIRGVPEHIQQEAIDKAKAKRQRKADRNKPKVIVAPIVEVVSGETIPFQELPDSMKGLQFSKAWAPEPEYCMKCDGLLAPDETHWAPSGYTCSKEVQP